MKKYVTYLRVSTQKQGKSGLGLAAQRKMCSDFIERCNGSHDKEFVDVESGTHRDRVGLWQAIEYCQRNDFGLVIAKLDRLSRDVEFTFKVINTGIEIHFTDMPAVNTMILGVFASVAQYERELVSSRTKAALKAKRAKGAKLGAANAKYKRTRSQRSQEELTTMYKARGKSKNTHHQQSRDFLAFIKVLRSIFPDVCVGEPNEWDWPRITTRGILKDQILNLMSDYKEMDGSGQLFRKWNFSAERDKKIYTKLTSYIQATRKSILFSNHNK